MTGRESCDVLDHVLCARIRQSLREAPHHHGRLSPRPSWSPPSHVSRQCAAGAALAVHGATIGMRMLDGSVNSQYLSRPGARELTFGGGCHDRLSAAGSRWRGCGLCGPYSLPIRQQSGVCRADLLVASRCDREALQVSAASCCQLRGAAHGMAYSLTGTSTTIIEIYSSHHVQGRSRDSRLNPFARQSRPPLKTELVHMHAEYRPCASHSVSLGPLTLRPASRRRWRVSLQPLTVVQLVWKASSGRSAVA